MLVDSYKQESNYKRKYRLVNVNEGIDLIPFVKNRDMKYSKFEQKKDGSMSANSMSFTLSFPYNTSNVTVNSSSPMLIDAEILKNYMIDLEAFAGLEEPKATGTISLANLLKKGDNVILFEETENDLLVFDGIAEAPKIKRDKTHIYLNVEVKDRTYSLYELKHLEESFYQNMLLCSTSNKANSLIHQIAYKLGFKDEELDLPNLTTVIPFVLFKKDELIIKELAYAVRLIGGVFTIEKGKLVVRAEANRITETYVFDKRNILSEISIDPVFPNYEKLKVTYDYYFEKDKQDMWILVGENGNLNSANIVIRAGQDRKFLVDWLYNVDLVKEYELYEAVFTLVDGTEIPFPYVLDINETGGTLTLDNKANNFDVYVKKFKIKGIPLFMQTGNQSYYPANINSEKLLDNLENKFIQNSDLALLFLKANYNENCKFYRSISFSTNVSNYLEPCRKIYLNHVDYTGYVVIEKIDFQGLKMSIQAREYLEPVNIDEIKTLEKSSVDEYEVISNKFLTEKGLYEANLPLAPQNLLLISQALGFTITFDNFSSNLRGHFVYLKKKTDIDWMKFFINTNNYFYQTVEMLTYEVKVSSVSINGVEGETTEVKEVTPIRLHNGVVDYPEGLSPSDLDRKVQNINQNISEITGDIDNIFEINDFHNQKIEIIESDITSMKQNISEITGDIDNIFEINDFHNQKIEIIESDITSMKQKDNDNYTAIQQNATQIQSIAQKTTANENTISQHSTAITQNANSIQSVAQELDNANTAITQNANAITATAQTASGAMSKATQNAESITSLVAKTDGHATQINQNAEEIESIAQKTTANESTISQHSTAITQNANSIQSVAQELDNANTTITQNANAITATAQTASGAMSKATQNAESITSLVAKTDGHATQINQNAEEIESIAQKTTANENAITQQGTAITQNANAIQSIAQEVETKTTASQVETITNTAIESFSANEFRRTLGTRVSIIDYSKNIDEVGNLEIDSAELEEVMIEDYYSSIYQNARQILALIKNSDEQYSVIQQLANQITLLVQEDSKNYSIIEQLANELSFVVKKDNLVSSINQSAEEIKINAQRIALGNGLVVEDNKVAVKSVFGLNFGLGIGVLGNQDGLILQSNNFRLYANTTTGDFDLLATGNIEFKNAKNRIYLDKENGLSQIILKANWSNNGVMLPEFEGVDFQIGEVGSSKGYFKFDDDEGVSMDIKNLKIDGNSILNYLSYKAEAGLSASSKYATLGMCKEFFGVTTFNSGWYIVKEKDGVSTTGQISYTDIVCNLYNVAPTRDIFSYDIGELTNGSKKVVINTLVGTSRNEYKIYVSDFATNSTCTLLYSSPSPISASGFIDAYDSYSKMFILNDKIFYQILIIESGSTLTLKTYSLSFAGVNTLLDSQTTTSSLVNFKIMAFKKDNFIYFIQNNNLYKTQDFITNILVHSETELSGYTLVGNEILKAKNSNRGKLWKISETAPSTEYNTPLDYGNMVKGGKYYYFIADTHFYISIDLVTYKKIFKEDYNTLIYPQSHRTVIMKKRTDSTSCDPCTMTGYTFGTLDW